MQNRKIIVFISTVFLANALSVQAQSLDVTPPTIVTSISQFNHSYTGITLEWTTDEDSDSQVEYGTTTDYDSATPLDTTMTKKHSVILSNLMPGTVYYFQVKSKDANGNTSTDGTGSFGTNLPTFLTNFTLHQGAGSVETKKGVVRPQSIFKLENKSSIALSYDFSCSAGSATINVKGISIQNVSPDAIGTAYLNTPINLVANEFMYIGYSFDAPKNTSATVTITCWAKRQDFGPLYRGDTQEATDTVVLVKPVDDPKPMIQKTRKKVPKSTLPKKKKKLKKPNKKHSP